MNNDNQELIWLPVGLGSGGEEKLEILSEPFPPREAADLEPLVRSITRAGVLCPILVRKLGPAYQVVCGWQRTLAARVAGLQRIPALVRNLDDAEAIRCYHEECASARPENAWEGAILPELGAPGGKNRLRAQGTSVGTTLEVIDLTEPASGPAPHPKRNSLPDDDARERVLVRARAFFEEVRVTRAINVPRTEILVDSIVEIAEGDGPLAARGFLRPSVGELTPPHSVLVTQLCARLARFLAWDDEVARTFVLGGFLHDVGMVFVSDTASRGPNALTEAELKTIQSHTRIGCALIAGTGEEWSLEASLMARDHHERWNGSGYPDGKRQTEVSNASRVLGLLDAYAALVTPRPHRNALEPEYAQERLCQAVERGLWEPTLLSVLREALPLWPIAMDGLPSQATSPLLTRNSVELRGDLVTMLAEGST